MPASSNSQRGYAHYAAIMRSNADRETVTIDAESWTPSYNIVDTLPDGRQIKRTPLTAAIKGLETYELTRQRAAEIDANLAKQAKARAEQSFRTAAAAIVGVIALGVVGIVSVAAIETQPRTDEISRRMNGTYACHESDIMTRAFRTVVLGIPAASTIKQRHMRHCTPD